MMRVKERKLTYIFDFEKDFNERYGKDGWNKENIEDFLFLDSFHNYRRGNYYVVQEDHYSVDTTFLHRINRFWAYPLTLVLSPFMYLLKGEIGWSESSKIGHWILKVCGYMQK